MTSPHVSSSLRVGRVGRVALVALACSPALTSAACGSDASTTTSSSSSSSHTTSSASTSTSSSTSSNMGGASASSSSSSTGMGGASSSSSSVGGASASSSSSGVSTCAHSECAVGAGLPASCSACAASIVSGYPTCATSWDDACVVAAQTYCPTCESTAACAHTECSAGGALNVQCSPCAYDVCTTMPSCCAEAWTAACVTATDPYGACACPKPPAPCAHSECATGSELDATCSTCAADVCADQPSCCGSTWDVSCLALTKKHASCTCATVCAHDECAAGSALAPGCSACTDFVCQGMSSCCTIGWTSACAELAAGVQACGCGAATTDGGTGGGGSGTTTQILAVKAFITTMTLDNTDVYFGYSTPSYAPDPSDPLALGVYEIVGGKGSPVAVAPASALNQTPVLLATDSAALYWADGPVADGSAGGIVRMPKGSGKPVALWGGLGIGNGQVQEVSNVIALAVDATQVYWTNAYLPQGSHFPQYQIYRISQAGGTPVAVADSTIANEIPAQCSGLPPQFTGMTVTGGYVYYAACGVLLRRATTGMAGDGNQQQVGPAPWGASLVASNGDVFTFASADVANPDSSTYEPLVLMRYPAAGGGPTPVGDTLSTLGPPTWLPPIGTSLAWFEPLPPDGNPNTGFITAPAAGGAATLQTSLALGDVASQFGNGAPLLSANTTEIVWVTLAPTSGMSVWVHTPF